MFVHLGSCDLKCSGKLPCFSLAKLLDDHHDHDEFILKKKENFR